jgi:sulfite reductase beta subunit-like hemoprotein
MAGTLSDIRAGMGDALRVVNGLRVREHLPEQVDPPVAVLMLERVDFHGAFRGGLSTWQFVVVVVVGRMAERSSQDLLDKFLSWDSSQSIRAALEADMTLGGVAHTCKVGAARAVRPMQVGDANYLAVEFEVEVTA